MHIHTHTHKKNIVESEEKKNIRKAQRNNKDLKH